MRTRRAPLPLSGCLEYSALRPRLRARGDLRGELSHGGYDALGEVSCTSMGSCAVSGFYGDGVPSGTGTSQAFVTAP
jgi:hypothetical protein